MNFWKDRNLPVASAQLSYAARMELRTLNQVTTLYHPSCAVSTICSKTECRRMMLRSTSASDHLQAEQKSSRSFSSPLVSRVQLWEHSELEKLSSQSPKSQGTDWNQFGIRKFIQEFIHVAFQHQMRSDCLDNLGTWLRTQSQPAQLPEAQLPALVTGSRGHVVMWQGKNE